MDKVLASILGINFGAANLKKLGSVGQLNPSIPVVLFIQSSNKTTDRDTEATGK